MQFSADADIYGQNSDAYDANKRDVYNSLADNLHNMTLISVFTFSLIISLSKMIFKCLV